ncbi:hypothetical protein JKF63_06829 [Porcisia hertigi]|uniref:GPI-anchored surface protein n=1 Tax=Porcisia hertigi TaxID=2761500 RepID=A0A836LJ72_9TRYP|nr:hypothetical protein JKF63_06829 [Porcisia hertigi]
MLHLLLELVASVALCAVLVFFALLNAPVEAGVSESTAAESAGDSVSGMTGAAPTGAFPGSGGGEAEYSFADDPLLIPTHELPLYTLIIRCVSLAEDTTLGMAYRWLLINGFHYSPREVYGERPLREMGYYYSSSIGEPLDGGDGGDTRNSAGARSGEQAPSASAATSRRWRRRLRRGAAAAVAASPTPLRKESACWVNVLIRCAAFLCLGGGTVRPEVWTDHLLYGAEKVLHRVNVGHENRMRARVAQARAMATQSENVSQSLPMADRASLPSAAQPLTGPRKPLLRIQLLELGPGLLGGPPREVHRPPLNLRQGAGDASGSFTMSSSTVASVTRFAYERQHRSNAMSSGHSQQPSAHTALDAANSLISPSVTGLSTAIAEAMSCVTTGGADSAHPIDPVAGASILEHASSSSLFAAGRGSSSTVSAQLGVVLPRVEGSVISVEKPYHGGGHETPPTLSVSHPTLARAPPAAASASPTSTPLRAPATSPLRCFAVPLLYEDQRFHVRLASCFPLGALLPLCLCVPPDVLTLNCAVAIRRIIFTGHLYAAFHGARVELSFPTAPLFTAVVKVTPETNSVSSGSVTYSGSTTPSPAFTAINTTRNEATAVRASSIDRQLDWDDVPAHPPLPLRPGLYSSSNMRACHNYHSGMSGGGGGGGGATTSGSCINERNEKLQEVVLLAVDRLIQSLTYPKVLVGELVCRGPSGDGGASERRLQLKWTRQTASLPLCM